MMLAPPPMDSPVKTRVERARDLARDISAKASARADRLRYNLWCLPRSWRQARHAVKLLGSYRARGWFTSISRSANVDADGRALPWLTYPAIDWLDSVLLAEDEVFEYGMGGSTVWMAERVAHVTSVEHKAEWARRFTLPANVTVIVAECHGDKLYAEESDPYVATIRQSGRPFNVVLVDGRARLTCMEAAHRAIGSGGLIILDNSDKPRYHPALQRMTDLGYLRIDFIGTRPLVDRFNCTSVFSRRIESWLSRTRRPPRSWGR